MRTNCDAIHGELNCTGNGRGWLEFWGDSLSLLHLSVYKLKKVETETERKGRTRRRSYIPCMLAAAPVFFIFFISPLTLVKPLPVTERTQLLYKAHRCVPTSTSLHSLTILELLFASFSSFWLLTTNPIFSATELDPSDFLLPRAHGKDSVFLHLPIDGISIFFFSILVPFRERWWKLTPSHRSRLV